MVVAFASTGCAPTAAPVPEATEAPSHRLTPTPQAQPTPPVAATAAGPSPTSGEAAVDTPGPEAGARPTPGATPAARVQVVDDDYYPIVVAAQVGEVIEWYNTGKRLHTITAIDLSWESGGLGTGEVFRMAFGEPGTYQYFCAEHPWMQGTVIVTQE